MRERERTFFPLLIRVIVIPASYAGDRRRNSKRGNDISKRRRHKIFSRRNVAPRARSLICRPLLRISYVKRGMGHFRYNILRTEAVKVERIVRQMLIYKRRKHSLSLYSPPLHAFYSASSAKFQINRPQTVKLSRISSLRFKILPASDVT